MMNVLEPESPTASVNSADRRHSAHQHPFETGSTVGSAAPMSSRAPSATLSSTSTALRFAAITALERALGRELPLQVKAGVRAVDPDIANADGRPGMQDILEDNNFADEGAGAPAVPLPHVVLSVADVKAIKDPETLRFLHDHSMAFLKYVGDPADPSAPPAHQQPTESDDHEPTPTDADTVNVMSSSFNGLSSLGGARAPSRSGGLRASASGAAVPAAVRTTTTAEDIAILAQRLCDEIATFITTVDSEGATYVIAADRATGTIRVPIDLDDGVVGDVGDMRDLELFDDPDDDYDDDHQLPQLQDDEETEVKPDEHADGDVASTFAEMLVKMRRERAANAQTEHTPEANVGVTAEVVDDTTAAEMEDEEEVDTRSSQTTDRRLSAGITLAPQQQQSSVAPVKLFQPTIGPAPNRRVAALMKFSHKDSRPHYMQPSKKAVAAAAEAAGLADAKPQKHSSPTKHPQVKETHSTELTVTGEGAPVVSSFENARRRLQQTKAHLAQRTRQQQLQSTSDVADETESTSKSTSITMPPEVRPQRAALSDRHERRIDWLVAHDDWEIANPTADGCAGDDGDDIAGVHLAPVAAAYTMPSRVAEIDALLAQFAATRGDREVSHVLKTIAAKSDPSDAIPEEIGDVDDDPNDDDNVEAIPSARSANSNPPATRAGGVTNQLKDPVVSKPPGAAASTAAAEAAQRQEAARKAMGDRYIKEMREARETRQALNNINDRLAALNAEVSSLYEAPFNVNRTRHGMHQDPASWKWPGEEPTRPKEAGPRPASAASVTAAFAADPQVRPPSPDTMERLIEAARREQLMTKWIVPAPSAAVR